MQAQTRPPATSVNPRRPAQTPLVNELLRAGRDGDVGRFDELFDLWLRAVFSRASVLRSEREAAEELTRKVLIEAVRAAATAL